jgi:drug/metabolite transporter (DMT)-like permease
MVLGAATGFGTIGIFGESAVANDLAFATLLPYRFGFATFLVLVVAGVRNWSFPRSPREWVATLVLGVVYTAMTLFYFVSLRYLTAGLATIVLYTYPAFVVVLSAAVLRETVTARTVGALALALAGVSLVVGGDASGAAPTGVALALGAATCYAIYTTASRVLVSTLTPRALMIGVLLGTTGSMVVYGGLTNGLVAPAGGREWGIVVGLALVGTVAPLVLFYEGVERLAASRVGIISTAEPVVTVVLGALLLDEVVTPTIVAGGVLVLGGVLLVQRVRTGSGGQSERVATVDGDP